MVDIIPIRMLYCLYERCFGGLKGLINTNITPDEIAAILTEAGFKGYRFDGALAWIVKTLKIIKELE